jgi:hypothetical protein
MGICYCLDCHKTHGAPFYAAAIFPQDRVTITGDTRAYQGRHFCPLCGSPVFARSDEEVEVHLGTLDASDQFTPTYQCWTARREHWLPAFAGTTGYVGDREG